MSDRSNYAAAFQNVYNTLDVQQKQAVDAVKGSVMLVGGPGTGKTEIIATRIAKILFETNTNPDNILCLAYTDAAVLAMRKRLGTFIGPAAYRVNIFTLDELCDDIIGDNIFVFERHSMDKISALEKVSLYKKLIDAFPKNHPLKRSRGDVYFEINNLQNLFELMKREGWTSAYINEKINEAGSNTKYEKLRAAAYEYDRFQQLLLSHNRYERDDLINPVIKAFEENPDLLKHYQQQFLYILIDEYQEINASQNRFLQLLAGASDIPNIFVAGDDEQHIFSSAESANKHWQKIILTNNYRSVQPVLDVAKSLINKKNKESNFQIDTQSKDPIYCNDKWKYVNYADYLPKIKIYDTGLQEIIGIVLQVEKLLQQGVLPAQIGILFRENKLGEELALVLKTRNIAVNNVIQQNILEIPSVRQVVLLLNYLAAEHDSPFSGDEMLFEILHFDFLQIPAIEIAKLAVEVADKKFSAEKTSLRRKLFEKANLPASHLFQHHFPESMKKWSIILEKIIAAVPNVTLQNLVEIVIRETGILSYVMQQNDKHWQMQVLTSFVDFIKEETAGNPLLTLQELVDIFNLVRRERMAIHLKQVSGTGKGVRLLNVDDARGVEFEHVFIAGATSDHWEKKKNHSIGYSLPDTIFSSVANADGEEAVRRLFYRAITRAQRQLTVSYSKFQNDGSLLNPSMFVAEMQEANLLPTEEILLSQDIQLQFSSLLFVNELQPEIQQMEEDIIKRLLDKFVMNATALNNYLKCPLDFYFHHLIRVPGGKSEATEFGSAIHHALQLLFEKMQANNNFPDVQEFVSDFNWYMHRHRQSFTKEQFDRRLEYGADVLKNYYDNYIQCFNKVVAVERNIRNIVVNGIPLKGKIDKLEFEGKFVNVVDYKTGDVAKALSKLGPPDEDEPLGGSYWRQAVFYKILVDNLNNKDWKVVSSEFDFIEPDHKKIYRKQKIIITNEDVATVLDQISTVWQKIQNREFYKGCGKENCHWCNFAKTNHLAIALHETEEDEA